MEDLSIVGSLIRVREISTMCARFARLKDIVKIKRLQEQENTILSKSDGCTLEDP